MSYLTVTPAYGRDYTSAAKAKADWNAGRDFVVADVMSPYCGRYIGKGEAEKAGYKINIRYAKLRRICNV